MSTTIPKSISLLRNHRYKPEIDGLRAFAVITVVINHFSKDILPGGYLGVDIFFVISGFVTTSSLLNRQSKNFRDFISGFYERRIKRLVPALSFFLIITSVLICMFNPYPGNSLLTGLSSLFGFSNIFLFNIATDYFAPPTNLNPFMHTWSLGVEAQFYILFPFLIWFTCYGRKNKKGENNLFFVVGFLTVASLIGFLNVYPFNQQAAYFLMPLRFWEIGAGCLIFILFKKKSSIKQFLEKVPSLFIFVLIIGVMFLPMKWAITSTTAVVLLSSILIGSFKKDTLAYSIFTNSRVVYIGLISYSLYLWHWGVLAISRWTIGISWWTIPIQISLIAILSFTSYEYIETPFNKSAWFGKRWKTVFSGLSLLFITSLSILSISQKLSRRFLYSISNKIYPNSYIVEPGIPQSDLYCHQPKNVEDALNKCLTNRKIDKNYGNIYLIGDSHASNHHWSIDSSLTKNFSNYELKTFVETGFINYLMGIDKCLGIPSCINNAGNFYKTFFLQNLKKNDFIFISMERGRFAIGDFKGKPRKGDTVKLKFLEERLLEISNIVNRKKAKLVLIGDIPKVCPDRINYSFTIIKKGEIKKCDTPKSISKRDRNGINNVFLKIAKSSKNIIYIDPHDELCTNDICRVIDKNGLLLYSDEVSHFTKGNKNYLSGYWQNVLKKFEIIN